LIARRPERSRIGVPNRAIASRNGWLERLVADAEHEIAVQHVRQGGSRRRIGQAVEIEAAHRSGHVAAERLGLKTHGAPPGRHDNVRADPMNLKRGTR